MSLRQTGPARASPHGGYWIVPTNEGDRYVNRTSIYEQSRDQNAGGGWDVGYSNPQQEVGFVDGGSWSVDPATGTPTDLSWLTDIQGIDTFGRQSTGQGFIWDTAPQEYYAQHSPDGSLLDMPGLAILGPMFAAGLGPALSGLALGNSAVASGVMGGQVTGGLTLAETLGGMGIADAATAAGVMGGGVTNGLSLADTLGGASGMLDSATAAGTMGGVGDAAITSGLDAAGAMGGAANGSGLTLSELAGGASGTLDSTLASGAMGGQVMDGVTLADTLGGQQGWDFGEFLRSIGVDPASTQFQGGNMTNADIMRQIGGAGLATTNPGLWDTLKNAATGVGNGITNALTGGTGNGAYQFPWLNMLNGLLNFDAANNHQQQLIDLLKEAQAKADPFADQRPGYQAQLRTLTTNPSAFFNDPAIRTAMGAAQDSAGRKLSSQGYNMSGNFAEGVNQAGMRTAFEQYLPFMDQIGTWAGGKLGQGNTSGMTGTLAPMIANGINQQNATLGNIMTNLFNGIQPNAGQPRNQNLLQSIFGTSTPDGD